MTSAATLSVGNERLIAETPKNSGNLVETLKTWLSSNGGAFDFMNTIKKSADLFGYQHLLIQTKGFVAANCLPRMVVSPIDLYYSVKQFQSAPQVTPSIAADLTHKTTDVLTTGAYTMAFLSEAPKKYLAAAAYLNLANDITDTAAFAAQYSESVERLKQTEAAPIVHRAVENDIVYSKLKLVKTVAAVVASFFACYLLWMGTALVSPVIAVTVALTSSIFNILAYYHKNYLSDVFLKVEYTPLKLA